MKYVYQIPQYLKMQVSQLSTEEVKRDRDLNVNSPTEDIT